MGASKSTEVIVPNPLVEVEQPIGFNVTITKDGKVMERIEGSESHEDRILNSFTAGQQEYFKGVDTSMVSVAAIVYDSCQRQLVEMQNEQLDTSNKLVCSCIRKRAYFF
jgi:hypothetical protein